MGRETWGLWREMEDGGKDTGCGVALAKARFANEETKVQVGNSRSGFASL